MLTPEETETHAQAFAVAFLAGRGYSVEIEDGRHLFFCPSTAMDGTVPKGTLLVCQEGKGAVLLSDPTHFNKFVFVGSGFSIAVGALATNLIKAMLAHLNRGASLPPLLTDGKEHSHE